MALALTVLLGTLVPTAQAAPLDGPLPPAAAPATVDDYAAYVGQSTCDPVAKPGTRALAEMLLTHYGMGHSGGIVRDCAIGGRSEHKEGRAWDWMLSIVDPAERATAEQVLEWLTAPGPNGEGAYNARRLGVMYLIWNHRIWMADRAELGWQPYGGPNPHTDHIHISLSWAGALMETSWWNGAPAPRDTPPQEPATPAPAVGSSYTVVPGDTLFEISLDRGVTVEALKAANRLTSDTILVGQVLTIPSGQKHQEDDGHVDDDEDEDDEDEDDD